MEEPTAAPMDPSNPEVSPKPKSLDFKTIFFHKTNIERVINKEIKIEELFQTETFKLQNSIQRSLNDHKTVLNK